MGAKILYAPIDLIVNIDSSRSKPSKMKMKFDQIPLIQISQKEILKMHELYDFAPETLEDRTKIVIQWCRQQPHLSEAVPFLVKTFCIQRCLLLCKGSIELCKQKIDRIITARGLVPELTFNRTTDEFRQMNKYLNHLMLPKPVPTDFSSVIISQVKEYNDDISLLTYFRYMLMMAEYRIYFQYGIALRIIIDLKKVPASFVLKMNPVLIRKSDFIRNQCYGSKLNGIHILNAPNYVDKVVAILKLVLKPKLGERIYVHSSYEDLHKHVPKEILPRDFGGDETSCSELSDAWFDLLSTEESQQMIRDFDNIKTDESKRVATKFNDEYMGIPGSFKKLQVD